MSAVDRRDAIVIGAGPAGGAAALHLARAGWRVAVLERKAFPRRKVCGEYVSGTNLPAFKRLGIAAAFADAAGPPINRAGFFAGEEIITAPMPESEWGYGRAISRQTLDLLLLDQARLAGAEVIQPAAAVGLRREGDDWAVETDGGATLWAPVVVAAHGSWDAGTLPTQPARAPAGPRDLLAFKAHFTGGSYPRDLMPLMAFPGGYGGMTPVEGGRTSLSVCVRRRELEAIRARHPGGAGEAMLAYLRRVNRGVRETMAGAVADGAWLAAGPIRPGVRLRTDAGLFQVGNAAGEAHPAIAEGITMGMQAGALVAGHLAEWAEGGRNPAELAAVGAAYAGAWRSAFLPRLRLSRLLAHFCMSPTAVRLGMPLLRRRPGIVRGVARLTGKTNSRYLSLSPRPVGALEIA